MPANEKSFDFAQHVTTQFITLSAAIPTLMITLAKDFVSNVPADVKLVAFWSWGVFALSVFFGLLTLMALTGVISKPEENPDGINSSSVRIFSGCQILTFFVGLALVVVFGWKAA